MFTITEKILFVIASLASLYYTYRGVKRILGHIASGQGKINWSIIPKRIGELFVKVGLLQSVFRFRLVPSIFHALIGWSFLSLALIDLTDPICPDIDDRHETRRDVADEARTNDDLAVAPPPPATG